jgi:hypothetical protein
VAAVWPESGWQTALNFVKEAPAIISPILTFIGNAMAVRNGGVAQSRAAPGAPAAVDRRLHRCPI